MSITEEIKVRCYCSECGKGVEVESYTRYFGDEYLKIDMRSYGWSFYRKDGMDYWVCPKHKIVVSVEDKA